MLSLLSLIYSSVNYLSLFLTILVIAILFDIGVFFISKEVISIMWENGNIAGKALTGIIAVLVSPALLICYLVTEIVFKALKGLEYLKNLFFPRDAGYFIKIPYTEDLHNKLHQKKIDHNCIYYEPNSENEKIIFYYIKDYQKAVKYFGPLIILETNITSLQPQIQKV